MLSIKLQYTHHTFYEQYVGIQSLESFFVLATCNKDLSAID